VPSKLSLRRMASQPVVVLPSRSQAVGRHATWVHTPAAQRLVAPGRAQRLPQAPQWVSLVVRSASQPLLGSPSQSPRPALQAATAHCPLTQAAVPPATVQLRPQAPQWATAPAQVGLAARGRVAVAVAVAAVAGGRCTRPSAQPTAALARAGHARSQAPQWPGAVCTSKQPLWHAVCPLGQLSVHTPMAHTCPAAQAVPQAPQLPLSARVFTSHPLAGSPSQSRKPSAQAITAQRPIAHDAVALGEVARAAAAAAVGDGASLRPPRSRCWRCRRSRRGPCRTPATAQTPLLHAGVPCGVVHARPQAPQWAVLARRSASQPLAASASQSA
jgi:hypothetical protein